MHPSLNPLNITPHPQAAEYSGCSFVQDGKLVIYRTGKTTPKKIGQFVTFWRRNAAGFTEPYSDLEDIHFYILHCTSGSREGLFILPKSSALIQHGILSTATKDGKRGFRVYPSWDKPTSKQATKTQQWQQQYFVKLSTAESEERVKAMLSV